MTKLMKIQLLLLASVFSAYSAIASAQGTVARSGNVSKSATITAINQSTRVVTLKDEKGNVERAIDSLLNLVAIGEGAGGGVRRDRRPQRRPSPSSHGGVSQS